MPLRSTLQLSVALGLLALMNGCAVLFWQSRADYAGGRWQDNKTFFEVRHDYEYKKSWFALNQNVRSRRFKSTILKHTVDAEVQSHVVVGSYAGWTLEHSVFPVPGGVLALRGRNDSLGGPDRELIFLPFNKKPRTWKTATAGLLMAAVPAHNNETIALLSTQATMERRTGKITVEFLRPSEHTVASLHSVQLKWAGAPGMPNVAWSADNRKLYIHRNTDVIEITAQGAKVRVSKRFPTCYLRLVNSNVSPDGRAFFRERGGKPQLRKVEQWVSQVQVPLTSSVNKIGSGCP